jgi:hypothetical protein
MKEIYLVWVHQSILEGQPTLARQELFYPSNEDLRKIAKEHNAKYIHIEKLFEFDQ